MKVLRFAILLVLMSSFIYADTFPKDGQTNNITPIITYLLSDNQNKPDNETIIINHKTDKLGQIPEKWINKAKEKLHILYQHQSHGVQMIDGMKQLANQSTSLIGYKGDIYGVDTSGNGANGKLDIHNNPDGFLSLSYTANFDTYVETYLNKPENQNVNVVFWMWCWHNNTLDINGYINKMENLIKKYGENGTEIKNGKRSVPVTFIFATTPNMQSERDGENPARKGEANQKRVFDDNNIIRNHAKTHKRVLFDFYDLESYNPDDEYFGDGDESLENVYDNFIYKRILIDTHWYYDDTHKRKNWANEYLKGKTKGVHWYDCSAPHSQAIDANVKAYAMWWMFARLAGWDGTP